MKPGLEKYKKVMILSLCPSEEKEWICRALLLGYSKKEIRLLSRWTAQGELSDIARKLPAKTPILLQVDGKGILHKQAAASPAQSRDAASSLQQRIQAVLPGANAGDFYVQLTHAAGADFISVVRRQQLDMLLEELGGNSRWLVDLTLGVFSGAFLWQSNLIASTGQESILLPTHKQFLQLHTGTPVALLTSTDVPLPQSYQVDQERIYLDEIAAYGVGVQWILNGQITPGLPMDQLVNSPLAKSRGQWQSTQKLELLVLRSLLFFFVLLLVNAGVRMHYSKKLEKLQDRSRNGYNQHRTDKINAYLQKKAFFQQAGWLADTYYSFWADTLASCMPASIRLSELSINPLDTRRSEEQKSFVFKTNQIHIKGYCSTAEPLREWISRLQSATWIKEISEPDYYFDHEKGEASFSFQIHLQSP